MNLNKLIKIISIAMAVILLSCTLSGCSGGEKKIDFIYPFSADVNSYDPQVAATADEFLIIENTFEGLIRIDDDGKIKSGVAEEWSISDDGLTYTFKLRHGVKWNINTEPKSDGSRREDARLEYMGYDFNPDITAHDFVFALRRAAQPETKCPLFSTISGIENAVAVNSGKMKSSKLGVRAADDYTLVIKLSAPDDAFMKTLSTAVAMPCNEAFFNATKGRYGLSTKYTLFNGQFYLNQILETSYLLKRNEQYTGPSPAAASELTLKITDASDEEEIIDRLESGYYDAAFIKGKDTESLNKSKGITYLPYTDTTWAFLLNTKDLALQSKTMRQALCTGFSRVKDTEKEYLSDASNLIPSSCTFSANNADKAMGKTVISQDIEKSIKLWKTGMKFTDLRQIELTVITTENMTDYVRLMLQGIQSGIASISSLDNGEKISLKIKVEGMSEEELKSAVAKKEYDIAFYPFRATTSSALAFLKDIAQANPTGIQTAGLNSIIKKAENSYDLKAISGQTKKAEKEILDTYSVCPMLFETSYYASASGVKDIQFHAGSGRVSFVYATRED